MSDLIDRKALLRQIDIDSEGEPGYYGDTWKFIDTIKSMPPAEHGTNLAEVCADCISRRQTIDAFNTNIDELVVAGKENADAVERYLNRVIDEIKQLPPANCSEIPNSSDTISRAKAIDAVKRLSLGETDAMRLAIRIGDYLERLSPARLSTNLAEVGKDCISRQQAIDALQGRK